MQSTVMSLRDAKDGETVQVTKFAGVSEGLRRRLVELGMICGSKVTVCGTAPLGDPMMIEVRGCKLAIRKADAEGIQVTK